VKNKYNRNSDKSERKDIRKGHEERSIHYWIFKPPDQRINISTHHL